MLADIRRNAVDRHRERLFGADAVLTLFEKTPAEGDSELAEITAGWRARRVWRTTDEGTRERGGWQFEIDEAVLVDEDSEAIDPTRIASLTVDEQRWKVTKAEEPVGLSRVWRLKAERQK